MRTPLLGTEITVGKGALGSHPVIFDICIGHSSSWFPDLFLPNTFYYQIERKLVILIKSLLFKAGELQT